MLYRQVVAYLTCAISDEEACFFKSATGNEIVEEIIQCFL
jgi:hypothetical protein